MQTILVATDGSPCGQRAEDEGVSLAVATGARLIFLHVQPVVDPARSRPGALSEETDESHALLDYALAKAIAAGVEAEVEIVEGNAAREIVDAARLRGADVIVVGSRGLGKLSGMFLGSVSRDVLNETDRPVLIVKEQKAT
ncbi:MAG TPA: universal stress protein [Gaiellaceae bacterium]